MREVEIPMHLMDQNIPMVNRKKNISEFINQLWYEKDCLLVDLNNKYR